MIFGIHLEPDLGTDASHLPAKPTSRSAICWFGLILLLALASAASSAQGQTISACGDLKNAYGPFDYRRVRGEALSIVEIHHFTYNVEMLISGKTGMIGQDLNYTLRAFPNHHRALVAMMRLGEKTNSGTPPGAGYSVECFFIRALTFQPEDVVARMLYAKFLASKSRKPEALKQLEATVFHAEDNGFTFYNLGLLYLEIGEPKLALTMAHRAYALGFNRTELKDLLEAGGHWRQPVPEGQSAPASSPGNG